VDVPRKDQLNNLLSIQLSSKIYKKTTIKCKNIYIVIRNLLIIYFKFYIDKTWLLYDLFKIIGNHATFGYTAI